MIAYSVCLRGQVQVGIKLKLALENYEGARCIALISVSFFQLEGVVGQTDDPKSCCLVTCI